MRYVVLTLASLALVAVAVVLTAWDRFLAALAEPAGTTTEAVVVTVAPGESALDVVPRLAGKGLITDPVVLRRYLETFHTAAALTPGEYALSPAMGPAEQIAHLESGARINRPLDIPAGATLEQVAGRLGAAEIMPPEDFLRVARRPRGIWSGVRAVSAEGFLWPGVYAFERNADPQKVVDAMVAAFLKGFEASIGDETHGLSKAQVVIVASLIERGGTPRSERRRYSAYLRNRLQAELPLHSEAARIYAATRAPADRAQWNTFARPGLPPGPICNPGLGALLAAADPAPSRALYRWARGDGTHVYCDDLACIEDLRRQAARARGALGAQGVPSAEPPLEPGSPPGQGDEAGDEAGDQAGDAKATGDDPEDGEFDAEDPEPLPLPEVETTEGPDEPLEPVDRVGPL